MMAPAVEELLRFTSPTQYMTRTTTREVELHGEVIPEGKKIALLLGSGNRDPREFDRPDEFDIDRGNPRILAFGHGAHVCLGAAVAGSRRVSRSKSSSPGTPAYDVDESVSSTCTRATCKAPRRCPSPS